MTDVMGPPFGVRVLRKIDFERGCDVPEFDDCKSTDELYGLVGQDDIVISTSYSPKPRLTQLCRRLNEAFEQGFTAGAMAERGRMNRDQSPQR